MAYGLRGGVCVSHTDGAGRPWYVFPPPPRCPVRLLIVLKRRTQSWFSRKYVKRVEIGCATSDCRTSVLCSELGSPGVTTAALKACLLVLTVVAGDCAYFL